MRNKLALLIVLAVFVSGFGMTHAQEVVELHYVGWAWPGDQPQEPRLEAFMEMYPHIKVNYEFVDSAEYGDRMMALAAAGTLPDVFWIENNLQYVRNGWLEDLTPWVEADETFDPSNFWGNSLEPGTVRGRYFGLPFQLQAGFLVVNQEVLSHFGLRMPPADWTYEDLWNICMRMNRPAQGYYGMEDAWWTWPWFTAAFSEKVTWDALAVDGSGFLFDDPDVAAGLKWATEFERNNSAEGIGLADGTSADAWAHPAFQDMYGNVSPWMQSKAAFHHGMSWSFSWWYENYEVPWDIIPYPSGPARQVQPLWVDHIGMSPTTPHKEEAFTFIRWMSYDEEGWKARMKAETPVPYSMPTIQTQEVWDLYFDNEFIPSGIKDVYARLDNGLVDINRHIPGIPEVWDIIVPARDQLRLGLANYDDIFPNIIMEQANRLMEEAREANEKALDKVLGK